MPPPAVDDSWSIFEILSLDCLFAELYLTTGFSLVDGPPILAGYLPARPLLSRSSFKSSLTPSIRLISSF